MTLPDGPRQILAAALAALCFLALYLGAALIWPVALALAALVYGALLLVVGRRTPLAEQMVGAMVSAQDVALAAGSLKVAADRLAKAAGDAPAAESAVLKTMAGNVMVIQDEISANAEDYRRAKRFISFYLPQIVETVEQYTTLTKRASGEAIPRLTELGQRIQEFGPAVAKIKQACLEADFDALEAQVDALGFQIKRIG